MNAEPGESNETEEDRMAAAVRRQRERQREWQREGEPSMAQYVGQIGVLGWIIVAPTLIGLFIGRWLDRKLRHRHFLERALAGDRPHPRLLVGLEMDAKAMIASHLTAHGLALAAFWLAAGAVIGGVFFLSLRWNVQMLATGGAMLPVIAVQLARLAGIGVALAVIAIYFGALPLLAATMGILAARTVVTRFGASP